MVHQQKGSFNYNIKYNYLLVSRLSYINFSSVITSYANIFIGINAIFSCDLYEQLKTKHTYFYPVKIVRTRFGILIYTYTLTQAFGVSRHHIINDIELTT